MDLPDPRQVLDTAEGHSVQQLALLLHFLLVDVDDINPRADLLGVQKILNVMDKHTILRKNSAYWRQRNSRPMRIVAPIPKKSC